MRKERPVATRTRFNVQLQCDCTKRVDKYVLSCTHPLHSFRLYP